ncbi:hypothetical protein AAG906_026004 [Vitis piasezkii]
MIARKKAENYGCLQGFQVHHSLVEMGSKVVIGSRASPSQSMMVLRHSCSLEVIRFLSHWRHDTYESLQRSLVISEFALYWGVTFSLEIDHRDTNLHRGMIMSERIFVEAYHFA